MALGKQYLSFGLLLLLVGGTAATTAETVGTSSSDPTTVPDGNSLTTPGETTTVASTSAEGGHTTTTIATTTPDPGPCIPSPCPEYSICQRLLDNYTCLCDPGLLYVKMRTSCIQAKTFSSDLKLKEKFDKEMANNKSIIFQKTANDILKALKVALGTNPAYLGSTVLQLKRGSVIADVENFYTALSNVTYTAVNDTLHKAFSDSTGILSGAEVTFRDICTRGFCDESSTDCESNNGLATCRCKKGYIKITTTRQACTPCPSGYKAVSSEQCDECPFGYSGFNCKESHLLNLVEVASVLGTLLFSTLISVMALYLRFKKILKRIKSSEKTPTNGKPEGIPRIPRANTNSGWQPSNLEMTDSGSRNALVTTDRPASSNMWDYEYPIDTRSNRNQMPSITGYGAAGAINCPRTTYVQYNVYDIKLARY